MRQFVGAHKVWFMDEAVGIYLLPNLRQLELVVCSFEVLIDAALQLIFHISKNYIHLKLYSKCIS